MSKKEKQAAPVKKENLRGIPKGDLLDRMNMWFEKNDKKVFYTFLFLSTLFSLLLFDAKVSDGGDDSSYIERAWSLLHEGKFPYYQGPGYPIFLSVFVKMFGLNMVALKFSSLLCQFGFVWFTYKTFVKRVPYTVLVALLSFISVNAYIQYYASQTFTETFFLFLQSVCFYVFFRILDSIEEGTGLLEEAKKNYLKWIVFGILFVALSISKSIAIIAIIPVFGYLLLKRHYKQAFFALAAFLVIRIIYNLITSSIYGPPDATQFEQILRKDLYKPELGHEDVSGLIDRFFKNFDLYMSLHIYRIMNPLYKRLYVAEDIVPSLAYLTSLILGIFTWISYKRNTYIFFVTFYTLMLCFGIFIGIQWLNMQDRLIIIAVPYIFMLFFFGFYMLAKRVAGLQFVFIAIAVIMLLVNLKYSLADKVIGEKKITALKKNLAGDVYYGYTPDWENFLKMSRYCADSLPADAQVISRKPAMSFIYGNGKKFVGQYIVTSMNADTVLMDWKKENVKYVILANLRMNPAKNNGRVINTIHRMLGPVYQAYPQKLKLVKSIGTTEKTELWEINY
ncbi:MAG: hypothetical protein ACJ77K_11825 [Bacteroidia bacterium]